MANVNGEWNLKNQVKWSTIKPVFKNLLNMMPIFLAIPGFVKTTFDWSAADKFAYAATGMLATFFVLLFFFLSGQIIQVLFGITKDHMSFAGALVLLIGGYKMTQEDIANYTESNIPENLRSENIFPKNGNIGKKFLKMSMMSVFPMAWPMIAGPGSAAYVMKVAESGRKRNIFTITIAILINLVIQFSGLSLGIGIEELCRKIDDYSIIVLLSKIMGFILMSIGASMLFTTGSNFIKRKNE